jgi:hypothetical protein
LVVAPEWSGAGSWILGVMRSFSNQAISKGKEAWEQHVTSTHRCLEQSVLALAPTLVPSLALGVNGVVILLVRQKRGRNDLSNSRTTSLQHQSVSDIGTMKT